MSSWSGILTNALISSEERASSIRLRRQVPLHLTLIAAEVRQHQEQPADHPRPEGVRLTQVELEVDGLEPSGRAGEMERLTEADVVRDAEHEDRHGRRHAAATMMNICLTSVHATACTPPSVV